MVITPSADSTLAPAEKSKVPAAKAVPVRFAFTPDYKRAVHPSFDLTDSTDRPPGH